MSVWLRRGEATGLILVLVGSLSVLAFISGCSRKWHRRKADQEAGNLVAEKGGELGPFGVYADPMSRLADPSSIDCPPLPPDDPRSHELMHCVDGKHGWHGWHRFGETQVESPVWQQSLIRDDQGYAVIDLREAVRISRLHSRTYQDNVETLYLSALDVSFERFRFDCQLFAGNETFANFRGREVGASSVLTQEAFVETRKLTATGGEILVGFANSLLWDFWGNDTDIFSSAIDFTLVQPLLRFGGRARVLENLTQQERNLLANARQMEQFRQGFFVDIITGRNSGPGPSLGNNVGRAGLGLIAGAPSGRSGAPSAGGYLGLLEAQQEIRNQASNITALRDSLAQLEAAFDANRISSRLQVDQARQALLNAQSSLLTSKAAYETRVDAFKVEVGLPPELPVKIEDPMLEQFILIDPDLNAIQDSVESLLSRLRKMRDAPDPDQLDAITEEIAAAGDDVFNQLDLVQAEMKRLDEIIPQRRQQLLRVKDQIESLNADVDPRVYDVEFMEQHIDVLRSRVPEIANKLYDLQVAAQSPVEQWDESLRPRDVGVDGQPLTPEETQWEATLNITTQLSDRLLELSLVQAEIRLQGISLQATAINVETAENFARVNRLDWMNARANLVDAYRKIEFTANALKSDLDVIVDGQLGTRPDNVLDFRADHSRVRFGVRFDSPTTRLLERNVYRESLINYQRARREFMLFEDRITQSLRNTLRMIKLTEINLEVRRVAVEVAIAQVDIARLKLNPPVRPNQPTRTSPTAARDLVSALTDLLDAQNDFLNVWVANEVLRLLLDFEMGTMQLDPMGVWIDTGISGQPDSVVQPPEQLEELDFSKWLTDPQIQSEISANLSESPTSLR